MAGSVAGLRCLAAWTPLVVGRVEDRGVLWVGLELLGRRTGRRSCAMLERMDRATRFVTEELA